MLRKFIAVLALALPAVAQEPSAPAAPAPAKAPFVFEAGTHELRPLVDRCAAHLQRNILLDGKELFMGQGQGQRAAPAAAPAGPTFELQMPVVTDRDGCEEMLQSLLWTQGLTIVALDEAKGVYEILSMTGHRAREIVQRAPVRTAQEVLARPRLRHWVTVAYNLKHINAVIASNSLRPFFASSSNHSSLTIGSVGNSATLLLCGPQDSVAGALALLQIADVAQGEAASEQQARIEQLSKQVAELAQRLAMVDAQLQQVLAPRKKNADEPPAGTDAR